MRETESHIEGAVVSLSFTTGPFSGIIFNYSKVQLFEDQYRNKLDLKFEYNISKNPYEEFDVDEFKKELGDHLVDLLEAGLETNSIVYCGGT